MFDLQNISEKAGKLFKKFGIKSITMDDVARELGMSKKTLYQFVSDKSDLIEHVIQKDIAFYRNEIKKLETSSYDPVLEIIELNKLINKLFVDLSPAIEYDLRKYYQEIYNKSKQYLVDMFIQALKRNIEKGKEEKIYRADIDSEVIAKLHISQVDQFTQSGALLSNQTPSSTDAREVFLFHINGLITDKGKLLLEKYKNEINIK